MTELKLMLLAAFAVASIGASAAPVDAEYTIVPPATATQCVTPFADLPDPSYNCYYTAIGDFTDRLDFAITSATDVTFDVRGMQKKVTVQSGRAHPTYGWHTTLTNVYVVDAATGNIVLQLVDAPFWQLRPCRPVGDPGPCSTSQTDDWQGESTLQPGNYALVINGTVSGNRPGTYAYSVTVPQPQVQPPIAPLTLIGTASCDVNSVCLFTPLNVTAIASAAFDFAGNTATIVPAISPMPLTGPMVTDISYNSDFTVIYFSGTATVTDGAATVAVTVTFDFANGQFENWQVVTQ